MSEPFTIVVEDSFHISGRGILLAPGLDADWLPPGTRVRLEVVSPGGESRAIEGRFEVEHLRLLAGGSKLQGVILLDESVGKIEPGSLVHVRT
jgi:hypothetical protein